MAKESLGFVKLEWTCPKCGSRNPGPEKMCLGCGAPQPDNVQFDLAETQELIKDEKEIAEAKSGPDIHCAFCGARNPAGAETCSQCGADLKEGTRREVGQVMGAFQTGPALQVACAHCGAMNPQSALKCSGCGASLKAPVAQTAQPATQPVAKTPNRLIPIVLAIIFILFVVGIIALVAQGNKTEGYPASIQSVEWVSSIPVMGMLPVRYQDWYDEIPTQAQVGDCQERLYTVQNEPAANAIKVCGTPYTVDQGSGYAEVVQDCQYEIYKDYCEFTLEEWVVINTAYLRGSDFSPQAPQPALQAGQYLGDPKIEYHVVFQTEQGVYNYSTTDFELFRQFQPGSQWLLNINAFNNLISIEPLQ